MNPVYVDLEADVHQPPPKQTIKINDAPITDWDRAIVKEVWGENYQIGRTMGAVSEAMAQFAAYVRQKDEERRQKAERYEHMESVFRRMI